MKKFLLSAAMLIAAIGMSATGSYYVAGNGGADVTGKWCNGINWDPSASANAIIDGQIVFTDVPAGTWEFKITDGTWANNWGYDAVDIDASSKPLSNAGNVQFTLTSTQDITVKFDGTNIIVLGNLGSSDFDPRKDYSIMVRVYSTPEVDNQMTFIGNGVYEAKSVNLDASFKIADANYSPINYGGDLSFVDPAEPYTLLKGSLGGDLNLETTGIYDVTVKILADWSAELSLAPATAVENVTAAAISTANGTIFAEGEMQIFDLTGKNVTSQNGQLKGNYIVVVNGQSSKVNVQ